MLVSDVPNVPWDFQTKYHATKRWMKFIAEAAISGMLIIFLSFVLLLEQPHGTLMFKWILFTWRKGFWKFYRNKYIFLRTPKGRLLASLS